MDRSEQAVAKFVGGYNCAQAVLFSFCDDLGLDKDKAPKIACGFGAGMGRKEEVCGAVSGGILVIGAKYGRGENEDRKVTDNTYVKIRELMNQFAQRRDTYNKFYFKCNIIYDILLPLKKYFGRYRHDTNEESNKRRNCGTGTHSTYWD